jgi:hypothetical protein
MRRMFDDLKIVVATLWGYIMHSQVSKTPILSLIPFVIGMIMNSLYINLKFFSIIMFCPSIDEHGNHSLFSKLFNKIMFFLFIGMIPIVMTDVSFLIPISYFGISSEISELCVTLLC